VTCYAINILHNVDLYNVLFSLNRIWNDEVNEDEIGRVCITHGEKRNACRSMVWNIVRKRPLGTPRCRSEYNIKIDIREMG
jgi:hypothetical protein